MPDQKHRRNTRQKAVILEELRKLSSHPTAVRLYDIVRRRLPRISLGTVYRNLELLSEWMVESMASGVSGSNAEFLSWLKAHFPDQEITVADCVAAGRSRGQAKYQLKKLAEIGLVQELTRGFQGRGKVGVYRVANKDLGQESIGLPSVEQVAEKI